MSIGVEGHERDDLKRIAELMQGLRRGSKEAAGQLVAAFYPELRRMAARRMRSERTPHTWQPTVLVNELYLELVKIRELGSDESRSDRAAFLGLAAHIMRRLLIHHARPLARQADRIPLPEELHLETGGPAEMAEIEALLTRLEGIDPQLRTIVEMRVFDGFSIPDIASQLNVAARTVDRRWSFARKWLEHQMAPARP
ncbi:MAG TPA: ECF-type sigma factor [Candidatus Acidoferrales bacterium]|jgi:RNA polymerase sigma-70 factor (ECF subfamily)|nr:ECF-type sigma factor [Candidatus Acidoferrales bacterium]